MFLNLPYFALFYTKGGYSNLFIFCYTISIILLFLCYVVFDGGIKQLFVVDHLSNVFSYIFSSLAFINFKRKKEVVY
jgi:hypothetical protein